MTPPEGFEWSALNLGAFLGVPAWVGTLSATGPDDFSSISVALACTTDAPLIIRRQEETQLALGATKLGVAIIGDGATAWRNDADVVNVIWSRGGVVGTVTGSSEDFGALEEFAQHLDALIPE